MSPRETDPGSMPLGLDDVADAIRAVTPQEPAGFSLRRAFLKEGARVLLIVDPARLPSPRLAVDVCVSELHAWLFRADDSRRRDLFVRLRPGAAVRAFRESVRSGLLTHLRPRFDAGGVCLSVESGVDPAASVCGPALRGEAGRAVLVWIEDSASDHRRAPEAWLARERVLCEGRKDTRTPRAPVTAASVWTEAEWGALTDPQREELAAVFDVALRWSREGGWASTGPLNARGPTAAPEAPALSASGARPLRVAPSNARKWIVSTATQGQQLPLAAAQTEPPSARPPVFVCVPGAWQQPLGDDRVDVMIVRHGLQVYLRLVPDRNPPPARLSLLGPNPAETPIPLRPVRGEEIERLLLVPDLVKGHWFSAGRVDRFSSEGLASLFRGQDWHLLAGEASFPLDGVDADEDSDEQCFDAVQFAALGNWRRFLLKLETIERPPSASLRYMARFYLAFLATAPQCAPARGAMGSELLDRVRRREWLQPGAPGRNGGVA